MSRNTLEMLLDLVEIKLGCIEIYDREDNRELRALERARGEIMSVLGRSSANPMMQMAAARSMPAARPAL
jgi:hypothetical protein